MADQQCGLCLSCGAPFMPNIDEVDFFNREANLSMLFLNTQFKQNADIQRMYNVPKLCSERQASHMFHRAYHQTALEYMCTRHLRDSDVGLGALYPMGANFVVPDNYNAPFLFYHTATGNQGPKAATWARPAANARINMRPLLDFMQSIAGTRFVAHPQQLGVVFDMCAGCNALMTQKSHMRFLLGCRGAGRKNNRGRLVPTDAFLQYNMEARRHPLDDAYGAWMVQNAAPRQAPRLRKIDSDAPAIAYYLHMCLPFRVGAGDDGFNVFAARLRRRVRCLYLELCWVVLEIACLAIQLEEGTVTKPGGFKRSHGQHQHLGVLDVYVSFFLWRLMQFTYGARNSVQGIDFVQFHQKYFCDARNCPNLLPDAERRVTTGRLLYNSTNQGGKQLVEKICAELMRLFEDTLDPLLSFCAGMGGVPRSIENYFLPVDVLRVLRARSLQVCARVCMLFVWLRVSC